MAKTFSIERILHGDEPTRDAGPSDGAPPVAAQKSCVDYGHRDLELMSQMAAAAYYPAASLLAWQPVQSPDVPLWYQGKELPAQRHQPAVHQHQHAVAAMFAPSQAGFPFGWVPTVNPSDFGLLHGGTVPYFPLMATQNHLGHPAVSAERLISPWHHHHHQRHQPPPLPSGTSAANHVARSGLAPGASASRKGGQIRFDVRQSHQLEETFSTTKYLTPGQRRSLAHRLALTERQVKTWFQNRRAKWRRTKKETKEHQDGKGTEKNGRRHESEETIVDECLSEDSEVDSNATHDEAPSVDDNDHVRKP